MGDISPTGSKGHMAGGDLQASELTLITTEKTRGRFEWWLVPPFLPPGRFSGGCEEV